MPKKPPARYRIQPNPELEKRGRRHFTPEYKLRIIEAKTCKHGEKRCATNQLHANVFDILSSQLRSLTDA